MLKPLPTQTFTAPHEGLRVAPLRYLGAQGVHTARSAALMPPVSPLLCPRASRRHRLPPPWLSFISRLHPLAQAHLRLNLQIFFITSSLNSPSLESLSLNLGASPFIAGGPVLSFGAAVRTQPRVLPCPPQHGNWALPVSSPQPAPWLAPVSSAEGKRETNWRTEGVRSGSHHRAGVRRAGG